MPTTTVEEVDIGYTVEGDSNAEETVVFTSGMGYGRWFWDWQLPAFEDDYRVVIWDLPGIDESDTPEGPYTIEQMANYLEGILHHLDIDDAHLIGISMGGMITQRYVTRYDRAQSIVLMSTSPGGDAEVEPAPEVVDKILNPPEDVSPRENIGYKMEPAFTDSFWDTNRGTINQIIDNRADDPVPESVRQWQGMAVSTFNIGAELASVSIPALVMCGEQDRVVPCENSEIIASRLRNSTLVQYESGGSHLFNIERKDDVNERIRSFLDRVSKPTEAAVADDD